MTDINGAIAALKARAAQITSVPALWAGDQNVLPDPPSPFIFFEIDPRPARLVAFGAGRGANLYRRELTLQGWLAIERGRGSEYGLGIGEPIAALFRSYRDDAISCFAADIAAVDDTAKQISNVGNYEWYLVSVSLHFDQIG